MTGYEIKWAVRVYLPTHSCEPNAPDCRSGLCTTDYQSSQLDRKIIALSAPIATTSVYMLTTWCDQSTIWLPTYNQVHPTSAVSTLHLYPRCHSLHACSLMLNLCLHVDPMSVPTTLLVTTWPATGTSDAIRKISSTCSCCSRSTILA